jgi:hypothetical protein
MKSSAKHFVLFLFLLQGIACAAMPADPGIVFAGCTPGDGEVRKMLSIPGQPTVDFIRWNLVLQNNQEFVLDISYGESKPNTLALKSDSIHRTIIGTYRTDHTPVKTAFREVVELKSKDGSVQLRLVKVTDNLFHILTTDLQLMVGNGGWSFQLNRRSPVPVQEFYMSSGVVDDTSRRMVFDGRTPCRQISAEHPEMNTSNACFKLKWQLVLERDPVTLQPGKYTFRKIIDNEPHHVTGRWIVQKGVGSLKGSVIYTLDPDDPATSMSFFVGDHNVLIFLDKQFKPYPGNEHFSVALNRRTE